MDPSGDRVETGRPSPLRVACYALFEAADSSWTLAIAFVFFGVYVEHVLHHSGVEYGWFLSIAGLAVAVLWPLVGAAADITGPRRPYLAAFVVGVAVFTASLSFTSAFVPALALFCAASVCANGAFTLYTAMLPEVSRGRERATVIGIAVGVGFGGSLLAMGLAGAFAPKEADVGEVFLPAAIAYLVLAFPAALFSPDQRATDTRLSLRVACERCAQMLHDVRRHTGMWRFLLAYTLIWSVSLGAPPFLGVYARDVLGFHPDELALIYGPAILAGAVGSLTIHRTVVAYGGGKLALYWVIVLWVVVSLLLLLDPQRKMLVYVIGPLVGLCVSGTTVASRTLLLELTPPGRSGETWGLFGLCDRLANVIGNLAWTIALAVLGEGIAGYRAAALSFAALVALGLITLLRFKLSHESTAG